MQVKQFRYFNDNLGYVVYTDDKAIVIDPGDVDDILSFTSQNNLEIIIVTNTHLHPDHTAGNKPLLEKTNAKFLDCKQFSEGQRIQIGDESLKIITTPGHTMDCVCFLGDGFLISGDTLFNGTVGNCFSGDLHAFFTSIKKIMDLPLETKVFGGHDYVVDSMNEAKTIEPDNPEIDQYLENYNPEFIISTLADEFKANPYIRFNEDHLIEMMKARQLPHKTEYERFETMMESF